VGAGQRAKPGGIERLWKLLDEHSEAVEYDLIGQGLRLGGLWTGDLTWRELQIVIDRLPPESATKTAMREALSEEDLAVLSGMESKGHGPWSRMEHLLAAVNDQVSLLRWVTVAIASKEPPPQPALYPRPGVARPAQPKAVDHAAGRAHLQKMRDERRHLQLVQKEA